MFSSLRELLLDKFGVSEGYQADSTIFRSEYGLLRYAWPWPQSHRNILACLLFVGLCSWFLEPLMKLFAFALENEHFSHLLLVPMLTFYLLSSNREAILTSRKWSPHVGLLIMAGGALCYWFAEGQVEAQDRLTMDILAFIAMCWGLFLFSFGDESFRKNLFALTMLLFMIPWPPVLLDTVILFLQRNSADMVDGIFSILGIQVVRDGVSFELSHFVLLVEEECSGMRSFIVLVITSLVAGHWFLTSGWAKAALVVVVVPLAIIKNASRIVGLALLANYVDPTFLTDSALHRSGGIPLFLFSLVVLFGLVLILRRYERRPDSMTIQ